MVSFSTVDIIVLVVFFAIVLFIGFIPKSNSGNQSEEYLLSGRKVGLILFILTNVATWYGGILGVGEFTYRYGLVSWFTQGFPYYVFAILFALFFAKKIRQASLYTIPDKLKETYGKKVAIAASVIIFLLVSPAPYLLMIANLLSLIFNIALFPSLLIGVLLSAVYLFKGGYKSDLFTDAFEFFVMFLGFIIIIYIANQSFGGVDYLEKNLPGSHLKLTGNTSVAFITVWFLIALWTFTDPGFHQRCYAAKTGNVARNGIIISVLLWAVFDFLTTTTGLYARAALPNLNNPIYAFPLLAEKLLGPGIKGIFYAALFATILSTLNSYIFLSATTFGRDFLFPLKPESNEKDLTHYTRLGLVVTIIISVPIAYYVKSIIQLWYLIGSICIPGIILLIIGTYYPKMKVNKSFALAEIIVGIVGSAGWFFIRANFFENSSLNVIEPMIVGLFFSFGIHIAGIINRQKPEQAVN